MDLGAGIAAERRFAQQLAAENGLRLRANAAPVGTVNKVWMMPGHVLRIARADPELHTLSLEASIAGRLPGAVRYPAVVASGTRNGRDWILQERVHAVQLAGVLRRSPPRVLRDAFAQLIDCLEALHATPVPASLEARAPFFATLDRGEASRITDELCRRGVITAADASLIIRVHSDMLDLTAGERYTLTHGDPHPWNVLWNNGTATVAALIDLESVGVAPDDFDYFVLCHRVGWSFKPHVCEALADVLPRRLITRDVRRRFHGFALAYHLACTDMSLRDEHFWPNADLARSARFLLDSARRGPRSSGVLDRIR